MFKQLGFVFLLIFVIALGYDLIATAASALGPIADSPSALLPALPSVTLAGAGSTAGSMTAIDFSQFDKGGAGYRYVTQGYGRTPYSYEYLDRWHNGIDIAANYGASVYSPTDGIVIAIGDQDNFCPRRAFGRFVVVEDDANHLVLMFAHLGTIPVTPLEKIKKGELIGVIGNSGEETGPHLHFSIYQSGSFSMDPAHGCGPYPQGHDLDPFNYLGTVYD